MSLNGYVDVTTFGASGLATTPQNTYIQNAINYCELATVGGGVVYFPPGTYCVDASSGPALSITGDGVEIRGTSVGSTFIKDISVTASGIWPYSVVSVSSADSVNIRDISFLGNNTPEDVDTIANQALVEYDGGTTHRIEDCYFTENRSYTLHMKNVTDAQVESSRFHDVGYNDGSNYGGSRRTDAVFFDTGSVAVRANHNSLSCCHFGAISLGCSRSEASNNRLKMVSATNIYPLQDRNDIRVAVNLCLMGAVLASSGGTPIYSDVGVNAMSIVGNVVVQTDADGMSVAAPIDAVIFANDIIDSNQLSSKAGDAGLQINPHFATQSLGITVVGNDINQGGVTAGAIRVLLGSANHATHPNVFSSTLMGNVLYGSTKDQIKYDAGSVGSTNYYSLQDDSNTIIGNGFWTEREHASVPVVATTTSYATIVSVPVNTNTLLERGGMRVVAGGSFQVGTSARHFNVGFGPTPSSATNILNAQAYTPGSLSDTWLLIVFITNDNEAGAPRKQQGVLVQFWAGGSLLVSQTVSPDLTINTGTANVPNFVFVQAKNGASGDHVTADFAVADRC